MKKILIVDDEKISLMMTEHILATQYATVCASSGSEAIEVYEREKPDMILTDLRMPGMTGFELIAKLHEKYEGAIPVMFMTADGSEETESQGFESGAVDYIRKPFRADILLKRCENILSNVERIEGLKVAAETDPMTGLYNKSSSQSVIASAIKEISGTLMMIDLDSFKLVNDLYGHSMGDSVLIRFAEIIRSAVRSADIVGRMGGDEFVAFCKYINDESVIADKAKYINDELLKSAKELMGDDMNIPLGASIGAVLVPNEGTDFADLYKKADKALYEVKQNGKHGYAFYHDKNGKSTEVTSEISDLDEVITILGERNRAKGAYGTSFEQFQIVYRFLARVEANYQKGNRIVVFSFAPKGKPKVSESEVSKQFMEIARESLRASDVVAQNSKNQVMVLLLEANQMYAQMVIERILGNFKAADKTSGYDVTFESDIIR